MNLPTVLDALGISREDLAVALVEHSIGYLTPHTAERHIQDWLADKKRCCCERCLCCFGGDLGQCLRQAAGWWNALLPEEQKRLRRRVEAAFRAAGDDPIVALIVSMQYPTLPL